MTWQRNPYYSTPEWHALSNATLNRDGWRCYLCGGTAHEADHVISRRDGGPDSLTNLRAICRPCHRTKSAREGGNARARTMTTRRLPERHPGLR